MRAYAVNSVLAWCNYAPNVLNPASAAPILGKAAQMTKKDKEQWQVFAAFVEDLCDSANLPAMKAKSQEMYLFLKSGKASAKHATIQPFIQDVLDPYLASAPKPPRKSGFYPMYQSEIAKVAKQVNAIISSTATGCT
jgi:hypothetical protein